MPASFRTLDMALKSGGSHAIAAFLSVVFGSVLSGYLSAHAGLISRVTETVGVTVLELVSEVASVEIPEAVAGVLTVSVVLSFAWGVVYHYARHG